MQSFYRKKLIVLRLSFSLSKKETVLEAFIKSSFLRFFAKVFGYAKNVVIAVLLGFGPQTDAYFMSVSIAQLFLVFSDVFDSVGVPNLVKARQECGEDEFNRISHFLFTFTTVVVLIVSVFFFVLEHPSQQLRFSYFTFDFIT